jgi:hypothetical protein
MAGSRAVAVKKEAMLRACDSAGGGSGRWQHFASVLVYWSAPSSSPQSYHCPEPACQQQGRALDPRPRPARTAVVPGGGGGRGSWSGPRNVQSRDLRSARLRARPMGRPRCALCQEDGRDAPSGWLPLAHGRGPTSDAALSLGAGDQRPRRFQKHVAVTIHRDRPIL